MSRLPGRSPPEKRERCPPTHPTPPPAPEVRLVHGGEGTGWASLSPEWPGGGGARVARRRGGRGRRPLPGDTRSLGRGGGASRRPGRGQSPDRRAALPGLSSGTTQVLFRSGGAQGAWRPRALRGPPEPGRRRRREASSHREGGRATCPGGPASPGRGAGARPAGRPGPGAGRGERGSLRPGRRPRAARTPQGRGKGPGRGPPAEGTGEGVTPGTASGRDGRLARSLAPSSP